MRPMFDLPNCAIGMLASPSMMRRHRRGPQQFIAQVLVDELVQVEQVLQQLPRGAEGGRHQLDQRLGIVGGDVLVGERRAQRPRMRRLRDAPVGGDAQRLLFDALAAALDDLGLAAVDQRRQGLFELAVDGGSHAGPASCRQAAGLRNQSMGRGSMGRGLRRAGSVRPHNVAAARSASAAVRA